MRVVVIDDHPIFRRGLILSLEEAGDLAICGEGASGSDAVALARDVRPDVMLLDLSMPDGGLDVLPSLCREHPQMKVAVLTASESSEDLRAALSAGAAGYIVKGIGARGLIDAVRAIATGEGYVAPALAARVLSEKRRELPQGLDQLTDREHEILRLVAEGHSNKEIAGRTGLQEKTVKHHMTRVLRKLNARNRTEAALILRENDQT
ncbi:Response regulator protein VraR [Marinibacterium anthonyi]|nr:Response regulator protein VraR [Marinibacterium anthonyi]